MTEAAIRRAEQRDLPALLDIYNHYIVTTPITFDIEPKTLAQRSEWFGIFAETGRYRCFVAECEGRVLGYACSGKFRPKAAYDTTAELSIYLAPEAQWQGLGRRLYATLIGALQGEDLNRLYGGVTLPNAASVALHLAFGFRPIGVQSEIGRKFGRYWDVAMYERPLTMPLR